MQFSSVFAGNQLVSQKICYHMPEASEVFLVWGINGWTVVPEENRPAGTAVKNAIMYTPMDRKDNKFIIRLEVPLGTIINYVFQITKSKNGHSTELWDTNNDVEQEDYRMVATQDSAIDVHATPLIYKKMSKLNSYYELRWHEVVLILIGIVIIVIGIALSYLPHLRFASHILTRPASFQILGIIFVAAILRFNHVTQPFTDYISWRQTSTAMMADNFYRTNWNILYPEVNWTGPGPGYQGREFQTISYIAALCYTVFGQHDWIGRSLAAIFGLWGIFALYHLIRLVWDEKRALVGAAVMAVLPGSTFIERSFLPDPAMVALVVTSFWMLVAYLQTERRRYLLLAAMIGAWGFLTKIPGLIIGLPMLYTLLTILSRKGLLNLKKFSTITLVAVLALVPVIAYYLWARHLSLTYPPYHFAGSGNWLWDDGLRGWLDQNYFLSKLHWNFNGWLWTKPVIILVLYSLFLRPPGGKHSRKSKHEHISADDSGKAPWVFHWWLLAGLIFYLIGAKELVINSWNFHILNPAAAALTGHAIVSIASFASRNFRRLPSFVIITTILLIIVGTGQRALRPIYDLTYPWNPTQSYKMGLALRQITQPGDLVVTITNIIGDPVAIYYSQRRGWPFPPPWEWSVWKHILEDDNKAISLFEELRAEGADWLGIVTPRKNELIKKQSILLEHINLTCEFHTENSDYIIYRILSSDEIAKQKLNKTAKSKWLQRRAHLEVSRLQTR